MLKRIYTILLLFVLLIVSNFTLANFTDNSEIAFLGNYNNTQWNTNLMDLIPGNFVGEYVSEIKDMGSVFSFDSISWLPNHPTSKALLNDKQIESSYLSGNIDMSGNVLLLHMDDSIGQIIDNSGDGRHGSNYGASYSSVGKLEKSMNFDGVNDYIQIPVTGIYSSFSQSAWIKTDVVSSDAAIRQYVLTVQKDPASSGFYTYQQRQGFQVSGNKINAQYWSGSGDVSLSSAEASISANTWYHIFITGGSSGGKLYINGQVADSSLVAPSSNILATESFIGRRGDSQGDDYFNGSIDEVSIYNRMLSDEEVMDRYKRAIIDLKYQVRSCDDIICLGENFIGPDGTSATYYSEINNLTNTTPSFNLSNILNNRYFQYQIIFETDDITYSPELTSLTVNNTDINENPSDILLSNNTISEGLSINTEIGILSIIDPDFNDNYSNDFSCLTSGVDDAEFNIFENKLRNNIIFDFETKSNYNICIKTIDSGGLIYEKQFTIQINDENEQPTITSYGVQGPIFLIVLDENITGTITTITATDVDIPSQDLIYSLDWADSSSFSIDSETGEISFTIPPDYENPIDSNLDNKYNIKTVVTDQYGLTDYRELEIRITDIIENNSPIITSYTAAMTVELDVNENITGIVADVDATDGDIPAQTLTYTVDWTDASLFSINSVTGEVSFITSPNYEIPTDTNEDNIYNIAVIASDGDLQSTQFINITVLDIEENQTPTNISISNTTITENNTTGSTVGTLTTTDTDILDTHTYTLVSGTGDEDNDKFTIVSDSLNIDFSSDYELPIDEGDTVGNNTYAVRIQTDDGNGGTYTESIIITVTNISEGSSGKINTGSSQKVCKDPKASNYEEKGLHTKALCKYGPTVLIDDPTNPETPQEETKEQLRNVQREALRSLIKMLLERLNQMIEDILKGQQ